MAKCKIDNLIELLSNNELVDFGNAEDAVDSNWIELAETEIGYKFSDSYKWFLRNYVGGEIGGEEIYSIYGIEFEKVNGGDIVFQYLVNCRAGLLDKNKLAISETDLGEVFCFDCENFTNGEYPILLRLPSGDFAYYAADFYDFLSLRVAAHQVN